MGYPYGELRYPSDPSTFPTDYRFTGQRNDGYIKLYQMGARWYDSALGRWISADTIVPDPANPQSFNRFSYVYNNPLRFIDPTGHFTEEELIEGGAYTAEELRWLAEHQANWYNYLMQAAIGDAFAFVREGAKGLGQFLLDDNQQLYISGGFWTEASGIQTGASFQEWGNEIGQTSIQTGFFAPEEKLVQGLPNPHIQLSGQAAETNASIVLGIDIAGGIVTLFGYSIIVIDTIAMPVDPAGKAFGLFMTKVGWGISALSVADTLVTSGPNSRGFWASGTMWASSYTPLGLITTPAQIGYDAYILKRIEMQNDW